MFKIGFVKLGNIATSTAIDLSLDEIAERTDIEFKIVSFGPKMTEKEGKAAEELEAWQPQLVVISSPNAATAGPTAARGMFKGTPTIIISDGPSKKEAREALSAEGFGYIILPMDPLIGAKREFLDPAEMALFNSDALRVLAACGAIRLVQEELDKDHDQHHRRPGHVAGNSGHSGEMRRKDALFQPLCPGQSDGCPLYGPDGGQHRCCSLLPIKGAGGHFLDRRRGSRGHESSCPSGR